MSLRLIDKEELHQYADLELQYSLLNDLFAFYLIYFFSAKLDWDI